MTNPSLERPDDTILNTTVEDIYAAGCVVDSEVWIYNKETDRNKKVQTLHLVEDPDTPIVVTYYRSAVVSIEILGY